MEKMDETSKGRRNVLHTMHDSELIRRYIRSCKDHVCDRSYLRHSNISNTAQKYHSARNGPSHYINYVNIFGNWKNATMQQWWFGSVTALSEPYYVAVHFLLNTLSMSGKTGKITPVISKWRLIINPTLKSALLFSSWTTNQSQSLKV